MSRFTIAVAAVITPGVALAHPDHTSGNFGLLHLLTDPFHVGLAVAAVTLFAVTRRYVLRRRAVRSNDR